MREKKAEAEGGPLLKQRNLKIETLKKLENFQGVSKLKQAALIMLVKMTDELVFEDMVKEFADIDKDQTYVISASKLKKAFAMFKISMPDEHV